MAVARVSSLLSKEMSWDDLWLKTPGVGSGLTSEKHEQVVCVAKRREGCLQAPEKKKLAFGVLVSYR